MADVFTDDVADVAVGLLIDVVRKISAGDKFVRAGFWASSEFQLGHKVKMFICFHVCIIFILWYGMNCNFVSGFGGFIVHFVGNKKFRKGG